MKKNKLTRLEFHIERLGKKCNYCGSEENLTIDHTIPKSRYGKGIKNIQILCDSCNQAKADQYPYNPKKIMVSEKKEAKKLSEYEIKRIYGCVV